jgi:zinc and cadmium transporter
VLDSPRIIAVLVAYSAIIAGASLVGGWLPTWLRLTHTRMQLAMSFVAGLMLGVGLLHLLPHAWAHSGNIDFLAGWMLTGLLTMFLLIRALDFHHHDEELGATNSNRAAHDHAHPAVRSRAPVPGHFGWLGAAIGMVLHSLIDGIALAASVAAEANDHHDAALLGLGTFLAVFFHKPLDAFPITTLMARAGSSPKSRGLVNLLFSLTCPAGVLLFCFGWDWLAGDRATVLAAALAFSAGVFLCISLGDLLPEVHFHHHDRAKLTFALLLGIAVAYGIGYFEPEHAHGHHSHGSSIGEPQTHEHNH